MFTGSINIIILVCLRFNKNFRSLASANQEAKWKQIYAGNKNYQIIKCPFSIKKIH